MNSDPGRSASSELSRLCMLASLLLPVLSACLRRLLQQRIASGHDRLSRLCVCEALLLPIRGARAGIARALTGAGR